MDMNRRSMRTLVDYNYALPLRDSAELRAALEDGEIHTLLMVYVHLTHDEAILDRFAPFISWPFVGGGSKIPGELTAELREKLRQVLVTPGAAKEGAPPRDVMVKMMSVGVAEQVAEEFVPMVMEQSGFERMPARTTLHGRAVPADFKVLVIGAGLTGLLAAIELERAGYDWEIIEKNEDVGGCWWKNRYPGVGVDTPSHFYSYSFEISPEWTHYRPHGADMREYYQGIADKYDLRRKTRFETKVTELIFDQDTGVWNVTVEDVNTGQQDVIQANAVFNAFGPADRWHMPDIPGMDSFKGVLTHSAGYDESIDLKGKKVAVIGTGASSAQIVATIAKDVDQMVVFMRSRHWMINNPETLREVTEDVKWAMRHIPHYKEWFRFRVFWFAADGVYPNVLLDPDWPKDSPSVSLVNDRLRQFALSHMEQKLAGRPDLLAKLTPDFPIFSKRIIMDGGWFDALMQPNATLEDGKIACFTPTGIKMEDGTEYAFDVVICATGFDHAKLAKGLKITGRDGHDLDVDWADEEERAYMGTTIPGYPNYFMSVGPNAGPNHAGGLNIVSEAQVHYMIECLDEMLRRGARTMEPSQEAFERHNRRIDAQMTRMIWSHPKSKSYYQNSKGRPVGPWPFRLVDMWNEMRGPIEGDYLFDYGEEKLEAAE